jgi:hypothetical protein
MHPRAASINLIGPAFDPVVSLKTASPTTVAAAASRLKVASSIR